MKTNARSGRLGKAVKVLVVTMLAGLIILLLFLRGISIPSAKLPPEGRTESVISRARHILEGFSISVRLGYLKERKIFRDLLTVSEGDDYIKINRQVYGIWKEWLSQTEKGDLLLDGWGSPFYFMLTNQPEYIKLHPAIRFPSASLSYQSRMEISGKRYPVCIGVWSIGENKINEFGYGDDVCWDWRYIWPVYEEEERLMRCIYQQGMELLSVQGEEEEDNHLEDMESLRGYLEEKCAAWSELEQRLGLKILLNPDMGLWKEAAKKELKDLKKSLEPAIFCYSDERKDFYCLIRFDESKGVGAFCWEYKMLPEWIKEAIPADIVPVVPVKAANEQEEKGEESYED